MNLRKKTVLFVICTYIVIIPFVSWGAMPSSAFDNEAVFVINDLEVYPAEVQIGEIVTIRAVFTNIGNESGVYTVVLRINRVEVDTRNISLMPYEIKIVKFNWSEDKEGLYVITINDKEDIFRVTPNEPLLDSLEKFRVGPMVKLRPTVDEIEVNQQDSIIELIVSNPTLNDVKLHFDAWVSVPANFHVWGEGFSQSEAAGTIYGIFEVPPGNSRTINLNAKAVKTGDYVVHFSGLYYPGENKDDYNPISLTHPIRVVGTSKEKFGNLGYNIPGFELILLIIGIIIVVYCLSRRRGGS